MTKKVVMIVCCILVFGTIGVVGLLYTSDDSINESYVAQYRKVTQDFQRTQVTTSVKEPQEYDTPGISDNPGGGGSDGNSGGTETSEGDLGTKHPELNYQKISERDGLKYQAQSSSEPYWNNVTGSDKAGNSTIAGEGCYIYALMSAGYNMKGVKAEPGSQLEDYVMDYLDEKGVNYTLDAEKTLVATLPESVPQGVSGHKGGIGKGQDFPNWLASKLGISFTEYFRVNLVDNPYKGNVNSKNWPTDTGKYIIYYSHLNSAGKSTCHWIYIEVTNNNGSVSYKYGNSCEADPQSASKSVERYLVLK